MRCGASWSSRGAPRPVSCAWSIATAGGSPGGHLPLFWPPHQIELIDLPDSQPFPVPPFRFPLPVRPGRWCSSPAFDVCGVPIPPAVVARRLSWRVVPADICSLICWAQSPPARPPSRNPATRSSWFPTVLRPQNLARAQCLGQTGLGGHQKRCFSARAELGESAPRVLRATRGADRHGETQADR